MDVLSEKERAEKENRELVEKLNAENAKLTEELMNAKKEEAKKEGEGLCFTRVIVCNDYHVILFIVISL